MRHRLAGAAWILIAYGLFLCSGTLALVGPSPVLLAQGGRAISIAWAVSCFACSLIGGYGTVCDRIAIELVGLTLGASASLTWSVALIMQSVATHSVSPLTAASLAATSAALVGQRWIEADRALRENRKE